MKHISEIINKILIEWSYLLPDGIPNMENSYHMVKLKEALKKVNFSEELIQELMSNLHEKKPFVPYKNADLGNKKKKKSKPSKIKNVFGVKRGNDEPVDPDSPEGGDPGGSDVAKELQKKEKEKEVEENTDLTELDFKSIDSFKQYQAKHKMRPSTKVNIAGKDTTVGDVSSQTDKSSIDDNRKKDHQDTDAALNYSKTQEKKDKESGTSDFDKGAGTHVSRAGEAATHKALRMLKDGKSYGQISEMLMSIANDKDTFLDKSWVKASLAATKQIEKTFGLDSIDEIVWDTKSGHKTIGVENHGTSADMFVKLKDGTRVGISLKKDGKVFIKNGGHKEVFKQMTDDLKKSGVPEKDIKRLEELASKESYDKDLLKTMEQAASTMSDSNLVKSVVNKIKSDDGYASNLGLLSRRDLIGDDFFQKIQEKIKSGKKLSGNEQKIMARIAASPEVKEKTPELYDEMRNADIRLTQRFLQGIRESKEIESSIKGEVLKGIHVEQILGVDDDINMDKFITVYGIGDEGSQLSEKTLLKMFGGKAEKLLKETVNEHKKNPTPESKKALVGELKSKVMIDYTDGAKDGIIKIKHEGPPKQEYSLFTIKSRARGIGAAPTLEMAQTTYMANVLAFGLDIEKWPSRQKNAFLKKQAEEDK